MIFQHVVPLSREHESRRRRSGAKVEIGRNDFQGAELIAPSFSRLGPGNRADGSVLTGTTS